MNHNFNTLIAKEYGLEEAILLENIYFWCKKNEANNKLTNGKPWTYNSVKAFNQLFDYLTPAKISRALKNLEGKGLLEVGNFNTNAYDHTKWYCITDKAREFFEQSKSSSDNEKTQNESKKSNSENGESIYENKESNTLNSQMNIADINSDNKPDENTDITSREQSCEPSEPTQSNSLSDKDSNSKSHCGKATKSKETKKNKESFSRDYYTQVYNAYFANYKILHEQGVLENEKPVLNYKATNSLLNTKFTEYGFENVLKAVRESINHHWLTHDKKYDFKLIFGPNELPNLINGTYQNFDNQSYNRPSYQQKQWTDDHLIL